MSRHRSAMTAWHMLILAPTVFAQTTPTLSPSTSLSDKTTLPTAASRTGSFYPYFSSSSLPPWATGNANDNAPNGDNNDGQNSGGLNTYYAVGLALLLCCVALALFFMFRRRAKEMASRRRNGGRAFALQRDVGGGGYPVGDPARGRGYLPSMHGLRRSPEGPGEEGLNERGEAPPQYISKREWEELHPNDGGEQRGPGIPLQTLSRDHAGLKPPDYSESRTHEVDRNARSSTASASSSRIAERQTNT